MICTTIGLEGALQACPDGTMLRAMEAREGDLLSRGYGAVLWEPDDKTVRGARVTRFMSWLADGRGTTRTNLSRSRWRAGEPAGRKSSRQRPLLDQPDGAGTGRDRQRRIEIQYDSLRGTRHRRQQLPLRWLGCIRP